MAKESKKQYIETIIKGCRNNSQIRQSLSKAGVNYEDKSWYRDEGDEVLSLWIDDRFRIFKRYGEKDYTVSEYIKIVSIGQSGVPTFMPSGRDTFGQMF